MFKKILIANRGESGRTAVSAKPNGMARAARAGELPAETQHA
jgi:acetyl/propionyl-CoA carboxylase alpha subunit